MCGVGRGKVEKLVDFVAFVLLLVGYIVDIKIASIFSPTSMAASITAPGIPNPVKAMPSHESVSENMAVREHVDTMRKLPPYA